MSDFETKTDYLIETKSLLKDRINSLGGSITSGTTFRDYLVWLDSLYEALEEKTITGLPDSLEGKCEQTGTPTPSSPQPINITTGRQVVSVCGKNLFDYTTTTFALPQYVNIETSNNTIKITTTETRPNSDLFFRTKIPDEYLVNGTTYTISSVNVSGVATSLKLQLRNKDGTNANIPNGTSITYDNTYSLFIVGNPFAVSGSTSVLSGSVCIIKNVQVEKGNRATTYEEYKGNDYEINLGKNLLPNNATTQTINGITYTINEDKTIKVNGTANGRADLYLYGSSSDNGEYLYIPKGNYTLNIQNITNGTMFYAFREKTAGTRYQTNTNNGVIELLAQQDCYFYGVMLAVESGRTITNMLIYPQLEKGSTKTSFSPYKTPIYLGKIGTYQDYIFKNTTENPLYDSNLEEGQWYIHKEIGRVVLNGSESGWAYDTNNQFFVISFTGYLVSGNNIPYCNYYKGRIPVTAGANVQNNEIALSADSTKLRIYVKNISITSANNFKTWLSTHNTEVIYVLNTPTNTLIEDEELINQLNEIEIFTVISEDFYN